MLKRFGLASATLLSLLIWQTGPTWAACASTIAGKDGTGASITTCDSTDGGTGLVPAIGGPALQGVTAIGAPLLDGGVFNTTQPTVTNGQAVSQQMTARGASIVATGVDAFTATLGAGTAIAGKVGIDQTTPGTTNAVSATNFPSTVATGTGAQGATVPRVTVATDSATVAGSASIPAGTNLIGKVGIDQTTPGTTNGVQVNAALPAGTNSIGTVVVASGCAGQSDANTTYTPISITASTQIIAGTSAQKLHVCHLDLVVSAADNVALVEGTGSVCASSTAGMAGGSTAATGWNFAANSGIATGTGQSTVYKVATAADNICLLVSSAAQVSGILVTASF